ncbi:MAG: hypothetical protein ACYDHF_05905 [Candidatus Cryosericum sp.]
MEETKHDRFRRIAGRRAGDLLEGIRILGNCSNTATYDYTEEDVEKIFSELQKALRNCKARFQAPTRSHFEL